MNTQIFTKVFLALIVGCLCQLGGPGLAFSAPCTSEIDGTSGHDPASGCGSFHTLGANDDDFGWRENGTDITSYVWELEPWGAGSGICQKSGSSAPPRGSGNNEWDEKMDCTGITSGYWYSDFNYVDGGQPKTAPPVWYYK